MADSYELSEDEAWQIALNDHPDLQQAFEEGTLLDCT